MSSTSTCATCVSDENHEADSFEWVRAAKLTLKRSDRDFHEVKPWVYWRDMLLSTTIAYASASIFLAAPAASAIQAISFVLAIFWLYRAGSLVHEVAHLGRHEMRAFKIAWNVLVGVPTLTPSTFFTGHHREHHSQRVYGTPEDPEYVVNVCRRGSPIGFAIYFLVVALFPLFVFVRFLLAPLTFITPGIRNYVLRHYSSFTFNRKYTKPLARLDRTTFAVLELLCSVRAWCIPLAVLMELAPWTRMFQLYLLGASVVTLNQLRQLADHHFQGNGKPLSMAAHIVDSCNYASRDPITWLLFPYAIQYHALHHLFPSMPYHNLASAHQFLMRELPADSPYRELEQPHWWSVAKEMIRLPKG